MTIDKIIQEKVGFGPAQWIPFIFLSLIDMNDGAQLVLSSFINPVIQHEWGLTSSESSLLASIFYLGIFFGSIISGKLSDQFGRKKLILVGSSMQLFVSCSFFVASTFALMSIVRFWYGFSFGFTIALTTSMFAESSPMKYRGKGLLFLNFCVSLGKIFGVALAYIFLDNFYEGNWKAMMIVSSLPNIIVLYGAIFMMDESPRFLIANQRYDEAYSVINRMIKANNPQSYRTLELDEIDKYQIREWRDRRFLNKKPAQILSLFSQEYFTTTVSLCVCWFTINFIYHGQLVVLPFIFGKQSKSFSSYTLTILGQAPSFLLSIFLVDKQNFGRKKSMIYFFFLSGVFQLLFAFDSITIIASICRFFMKQCFQMLYPCTTQNYGTFNRTLGFGFTSAIGRLGAFIMPYIVLPLVQTSQVSIFVIFAGLAFLGSYSSYMIPKEPMNAPLDGQLQQPSTLQKPINSVNSLHL